MDGKLTHLAGESEEYATARAALLDAELALKQQSERVAAQRRNLPQGPIVEDYVLLEGPRALGAGDEPVTEVRLSQLFTANDRALIVYHYMYGKQQTTPCPMCTMWIDGYNAITDHVTRNADFVVLAAAPPDHLRAIARERGWDRLRLISAGESTMKRDLASEDDDGIQDSTISVFTKDADGQVRHFYTGHPWFTEAERERGIDFLSPVWNLLDLTPQGRGEWYPSVTYDTDSGGP